MAKSALLFAAPPKWLLHTESVFPSEAYIRAVGGGASADEAKRSALAELSAYFSQTVKTETVAVSSLYNNSEKVEKKQAVNQKVKITSQTELFSVHYTETFHDKKAKSYSVCAYIPRNEAWSILEPKLNIHYSSLSKNMAQLNNQDGLKAVLRANKILSNASDFEDLYYTALFIFPSRCEKYSNLMERLQSLKEQLPALSRAVKIKINVKGDVDGRIYSKISSLVSDSNFTVCKFGENHIVNVNVDIAEQIIGAVYAVYPKVSVEISDRKEIISTFSKSLEKVAAFNSATVQKMALSKIENVLEEEFIESCLK